MEKHHLRAGCGTCATTSMREKGTIFPFVLMVPTGAKERGMSHVTLSVHELAARCAHETDLFNRRQPSDPQWCFELLRRALADGSSDAFTLVYQIYERQATHWVYNHPKFEHTGESAEYFASQALRSFYFALRGPKFERFPSLPQILSYLKLCVHTAIAQYVRDQQPYSTTPLAEEPSLSYQPDLDTRAVASELWQHICLLLPDERDRLLARLAFVQGLKPREIVVAFRHQWRNEREVSVALYRIRRTLRNDEELQRRIGTDDVVERERSA
jgi:hypothetical protein